MHTTATRATRIRTAVRASAAIIATAAVALVVGWAGGEDAKARGIDLAPVSACQEDEPCWDWRTMGDRSAGGTLDLPGGESIDVIVTANADGTYTVRED